MPEMLFRIRWPDGAVEDCYSPSLVVRDHLTAGTDYEVDAFCALARLALNEASERVRARYGFACSRALGQLARIEARAMPFAADPLARITVEALIE
jgi:uncharacterized repeat protein (TIGR04042 family)